MIAEAECVCFKLFGLSFKLSLSLKKDIRHDDLLSEEESILCFFLEQDLLKRPLTAQTQVHHVPRQWRTKASSFILTSIFCNDDRCWSTGNIIISAPLIQLPAYLAGSLPPPTPRQGLVNAGYRIVKWVDRDTFPQHQAFDPISDPRFSASSEEEEKK